MNYLNVANRLDPGRGVETTVTLVDESSSMDEKDIVPTRKIAAVNANVGLGEVKFKYHPDDVIAAIGFSDTAHLRLAPAVVRNSLPSLRRALRDAHASGSTNFTAALEMAEQCLFPVNLRHPVGSLSRILSTLLYETNSAKVASPSQGRRPVDGVKRIVLLSDGEHNTGPSPVPVASRLKSAGVVIDCIGIAGSPDSVDEDLLKEIASRNPDGSIRYCFIGDTGALLKKYQDLARHIRCA